MWNIIAIFLLSLVGWNETPTAMDSEAFAGRRAALAAALGDGLFYLEGNGEPGVSRRYIQDDDFYYLTGVGTQDAALLLLTKKGKVKKEILFLPRKNTMWERWNGPRMSPGKEAQQRTGMLTMENGLRKKEIQAALKNSGKKVWGRPGRSPLLAETLDKEKIKPVRRILDSLQVRKSPAEIARIERAIAITHMAFQACLPFLEPGRREFELSGAVEGTFLGLGAQGFAFPSIVGSGPNSCRLHYNANRRRMEAGDLVVMDIGAKYGHYCADITRTFPVSGTFTPRQREIYQIVLEAQKKAFEQAKPGKTLGDVHLAAAAHIASKGFGKNFWHGTSHFLGLLVHDTTSQHGVKLEPGMVFTIEPGIYLPEENLGIRIEDDILITADGARYLSPMVPREADEVEAWIQKMRRKRE